MEKHFPCFNLSHKIHGFFFSVIGITLFLSYLRSDLLPARSPRGHPGEWGGASQHDPCGAAANRPSASRGRRAARVQPPRPGAGRGRLGKGRPDGGRSRAESCALPIPRHDECRLCSHQALQCAFRGRRGAHRDPAEEVAVLSRGVSARLLRATAVHP